MWGKTGGQLHGLSCLQVKHLYITKELHHSPLKRLGSVRRSVGLSRRGKLPSRVPWEGLCREEAARGRRGPG